VESDKSNGNKNIISELDIGVVLCNERGYIEYSNRAALKALRCTESQIPLLLFTEIYER
jgi:hypothetical protein